MGFGFGGNKSSSNTNITDNSGATSGSEFDQGYDSSGGSGSNNWWDQGSQFNQGVWNGDQMRNYYDQMNSMWGNYNRPGGGASQVDNAAGGASDMIQGGAAPMQSAYQKLMGGGATGETGAAIDPALRESLENSLMNPSQTGKMYEGIVGGPGNEYIDPMIDQMRGDENTRQNRNASQIQSGAVGTGQSGSSRQGIAEGLMRSEGNRNLAMNESAARAGAYDKDLDWKMKIAGLADKGIGDAQDRSIGLIEGGDRNREAGMNQGQNYQNYGMGMMAPWMQANQQRFDMGSQYGDQMGGPTIIGSGSDFNRGGSESGSSYDDTGFGSGSSEYEAWREYQAKQKNKSGGFNASFGGG